MSNTNLELNEGTIGFELSDEYFANEKYFSHQDIETVRVWVESENDKNLWLAVLPHTEKWNFDVKTTELFNHDQKMATGCDRIQKLIEIGQISLGKNSIVCIDSDFSRGISHLLVQNKVDIKEFWYTTIVHSKENIFYCIDNVKLTLSRCLKIHISQISDFIDVLVFKISSLLFNPFILNLVCYEKFDLSKKEFDEINQKISVVLKKVCSISNNDSDFEDIQLFFLHILESPVWEKISSDLDEIYQYLLSTNSEIEKEFLKIKKNLNNHSIDNGNIYLFFRGHDIEGIFSSILQKVVDVKKRGDYSEIEIAAKKINEDIQVTRKRKEQIGNSFLKFKPTISMFPLGDFKKVNFFNETYQRLQNEYV